jgi:hypothetical protein
MPEHPEYKTPVILSDNLFTGDGEASFYFDDFAATLARLIAGKQTQAPHPTVRPPVRGDSSIRHCLDFALQPVAQ